MWRRSEIDCVYVSEYQQDGDGSRLRTESRERSEERVRRGMRDVTRDQELVHPCERAHMKAKKRQTCKYFDTDKTLSPDPWLGSNVVVLPVDVLMKSRVYTRSYRYLPTKVDALNASGVRKWVPKTRPPKGARCGRAGRRRPVSPCPAAPDSPPPSLRLEELSIILPTVNSRNSHQQPEERPN
ncbi:hypothetical protein LZ30DRAFT_300073 [Colletotrichum cereale]|nr:hypothetical protein LZ30DRAFT_300073 [Colletotrichum cereale]